MMFEGLNDRPPAPRIFASSVWGCDLDKWGAWGFADRGTRDRLAALIGPEDYVLSVGTMSEPTPVDQRGCLLALMKIGSELIHAREMIDPGFYRASIEANGGERWTHAFPIKAAELFQAGVSRKAILPRIDAKNLYRTLASHFVELTADEVAAVLALPRVAEANLYSTPVSAFAARLRSIAPGPAPTSGTRILTATSGPAATYVMVLEGTAVAAVSRPVITEVGSQIFKIGFSQNPSRRLRELNAHLPSDSSLCWSIDRTQWHDDEINAYAMEQEVLRLLSAAGADRFKGEMVAASVNKIDDSWTNARHTTHRPSQPVSIELEVS